MERTSIYCIILSVFFLPILHTQSAILEAGPDASGPNGFVWYSVGQTTYLEKGTGNDVTANAGGSRDGEEATADGTGKYFPNTASPEDITKTIPNRQAYHNTINSRNTKMNVTRLHSTATLEEIKKTFPKTNDSQKLVTLKS